mmetsp:Transcript_23195/g.74233  ORF Transcript_23195/g.74233 Transcript_23195/m.74233 type:complete len:231 (-) Transcript_23195:255-947(-)
MHATWRRSTPAAGSHAPQSPARQRNEKQARRVRTVKRTSQADSSAGGRRTAPAPLAASVSHSRRTVRRRVLRPPSVQLMRGGGSELGLLRRPGRRNQPGCCGENRRSGLARLTCAESSHREECGCSSPPPFAGSVAGARTLHGAVQAAALRCGPSSKQPPLPAGPGATAPRTKATAAPCWARFSSYGSHTLALTHAAGRHAASATPQSASRKLKRSPSAVSGAAASGAKS